MKVLQIVDSREYVETNCFQHQLLASLRQRCELSTVTLDRLSTIDVGSYDSAISCLKLRSLVNNVSSVASILKTRPIVVYDQDPWESFRDESPFKGSYERISNSLNVKFAVTSLWWSEFLTKQGFDTSFVKMWLLPEYCTNQTTRSIELGFIGRLHPYRKSLFENLSRKNINVQTLTSTGYASYLNALSTMKIFIYSDDMSFTVDGHQINLANGLWGKTIEAMGRGCFVIRNSGLDSDSYLAGLTSVKLYESIDDITNILNDITKMDIDQFRSMIQTNVETIKAANEWCNTAERLIELGR